MSNAVQSALHPHPCRAVPGEQGPGVPRLPSSPFTLSPDREEPRMWWAWPKNHTVPGKPASQGPASRIPEPKAPRRERGSSSGRFRKIPSPQTLPAPASVACCALSNLTWLCREHRQVPVERTPTGSWPTATEQRRDRLGPGRRAGRWQHPPPSHTHHPQVTREGESTQHLPNTGPFSVVTSTGQREGRESLESPNKRLKTESP